MHTRPTQEACQPKKNGSAVLYFPRTIRALYRQMSPQETTPRKTTNHLPTLWGERAPDALKGPVEPKGAASSKESNRPKFLELLDESNPAALSPLELLTESNLEKRLSCGTALSWDLKEYNLPKL